MEIKHLLASHNSDRKCVRQVVAYPEINVLFNYIVINPGKYELRPADKKLYQLLPKVSASRVSVASRVVNPKHDEVRPAVSRELYQLHRKTWVYKMSNNLKVLTQFYCTSLYAQLHAHIQNS